MFPDFMGLVPTSGENGTYLRTGGQSIKPFVDLKRAERGLQFWAQDKAAAGQELVPGAFFSTTPMVGQYYDLGGLNGGFSLYRKKWGWDGDNAWNNGQSVWAKRDEITSKLRLMWAAKTDIKPGATWESAEFVLTPHMGGWARGIEPYRNWVRSNIAQRKYPMPTHVKEGLGFRTIWMSTGAYPNDPSKATFTIWKFKDMPKLAKEAKEHGLTEMVLWMWNQGLQLPITPPFPQLGTEQDLSDAIAECKKIGVNVNLFISLYSLANPSAPRYEVKVPEEGGWTYDPELIPAFNPYYAHGLNTGGADLKSPKWRKDVYTSCRELIDKYTPSIGWDQWADYSADSGIYKITDEIRAMAKEKDPESTFCGESFSSIEMESQYLDYFWSWGYYGMFGDMQAFTSTFTAPRLNPNIDISSADAKYCFMDNLYMNVMPRREGSTNGSAYIVEYPELSKALKRCAALRKQFLPYFLNGELVGYCFLAQDCPEAHFNAYILPGRILIIALKEEKAGALKMNIDLGPWLKSNSGSYAVKTYSEDGKVVSESVLTGSKGTINSTKLSKNELAIFEITSK